MRIGIVTPFFPPHTGGVETCAYYLAKTFHNMGHKVTVFTSYTAGDRYPEPFGVHRLKAKVHLFGAPILTGLPKKILDEPLDVMHTFFPTAMIADTAVLMSKLKGIPSVIYHYNDLFEEGINIRRFMIESYNSTLFQTTLGLSDKIVVSARRNIGRSRIKYFKGKTVVIPTGIDTTLFHQTKPDEKLRKRLGISKDELALLFVSVLNPWHKYKGLDYLLEGLSSLDKKFKLIVVGSGLLLDDYKSMAKGLGLENKVIFTGGASHKTLPSYYSIADVFLLPSINKAEGFGIVAAEAMACGVPVITTTEAGISEYIQKNKAGMVVKPRSAVQLRDAILGFYDRKFRDTLAKRSRVFASKELEFTVMAARLLRLYESLVNKK